MASLGLYSPASPPSFLQPSSPWTPSTAMSFHSIHCPPGIPEHRSGTRLSGSVSVFPLASCVTLGEFLNLSVPPFPRLLCPVSWRSRWKFCSIKWPPSSRRVYEAHLLGHIAFQNLYLHYKRGLQRQKLRFRESACLAQGHQAPCFQARSLGALG